IHPDQRTFQPRLPRAAHTRLRCSSRRRIAGRIAHRHPTLKPRPGISYAEIVTDSQRSDPWPIRTPRLQIRRCTPQDLDAVWEFRRIPEVNRWLGLAPATLEAFRERYLDPDRLAATFVIELLATDESAPALIGDLMVRIEDAW